MTDISDVLDGLVEVELRARVLGKMVDVWHATHDPAQTLEVLDCEQIDTEFLLTLVGAAVAFIADQKVRYLMGRYGLELKE